MQSSIPFIANGVTLQPVFAVTADDDLVCANQRKRRGIATWVDSGNEGFAGSGIGTELARAHVWQLAEHTVASARLRE